MSAVQIGNGERVAVLYRDHRDWLTAWLNRSLGCVQRAEDLSQDTFVRVLGRRELPSLREPRAFLVTVAKGLLVDHWRRVALEQAYLEELHHLPEAVQPSVEEHCLILADLREIDRLLGSLSARARSAFLLNRLDGLGHAEIAEQLGVSVPRVRQYIAQGLRQCYIALYGAPT
ncbi:RNA polymerase sigma factor [Pseudomonas sp. SCB32]|uniref:RNA polymerase sigma factor n=1 Tax=Pseudomonas sp. SCB32 TaxID=2653853 RepID=UPI0021151F58|nr:RNA polymerase sigma factor [Pseudomonas sp. SCB32]